MNQETIENHIKHLGKVDFDKVCNLILTKIFGIFAIDVDKKGDGGSDYIVITDATTDSKIAIQKTVQDNNWQAKVIKNATEAKTKLGISRYFFLTARAHESTKFRSLEQKIYSDLRVTATCLGATEIAGMIMESRLLGDFARAIELPLDISQRHYPDDNEILLHTYFSMSEDVKNLHNEIYENSLLSILKNESSELSKDEILSKTMILLGLSETYRIHLSGRLDALLTSCKVCKVGQGFTLSPEMREKLNISDGIYVSELNQLASAQLSLLNRYAGVWDQEKSQVAAVLLARCFTEEQIETAKSSSLSFTMTGFEISKEKAIDKLRKLLSTSHIKNLDLDLVIEKMIELARDTVIIKKLTSAVTFVALGNNAGNKASAILGASEWNEIKVVLDTTVAIPYLVCSLFSPSSGRFSKGSHETVSMLKRQGAKITIPWVYLNECASHLIRAFDYCKTHNEFKDTLAFSRNGYVSHYYQIKESGSNAPNTLKEYIEAVSEYAIKNYGDKYDGINKVMTQLQPLFARYGVKFEEIPKLNTKYRKGIETEYTYSLKDQHRSKSSKLVEHDVDVLGHILRCYSENSEKIILLTWDGVMLAVGNRVTDLSWVISPIAASDLFRAKLSLSDGKLLSLACNLARTMDKPIEYGARIIDRAVELSGEKLEDWEYRKRIKAYQEQAMKHYDFKSSDFNMDKFDNETDTFLKSEGIIIPSHPLEDEEITN